MISRRRKLEKGQSLVVVTLLLFAFFAILALVLDGGYTYWMRRNAQNSADAGALAGADTLCKYKYEGEVYAENQAEIVAENFAVVRNGVNNANITTTATAVADLINLSGGYVAVTTNIQFQSFFGRILGRESVIAPGYAKAGCAPPEAVAVMPIAWSCREPIGGSSAESPCVIHKIADYDCSFAAGDPMYIIADSNDIEMDTLCQDEFGEPVGAVDCDLDGDGEDNINLLAGGDRSWLDLNGDGGGAAELIDWIEGDFEDLYVRPHTWVPVQSGVTGSVYDNVYDHIIDVPVVLPIFDLFWPDGYPPQPLHPGDDVKGDDPQDYYHIIAFSNWVTTCVDSASHGPCPGRLALNDLLIASGQVSVGDIASLKTIEGCFVAGDVGGIGGEPGQGIDTGSYNVFLTE